jgi:hypothetical protein
VKHLKGINQKAARIEAYVQYEAAQARATELDVVALETPKPPTKKMGRTSRLGARSSSSPAGKRISRAGPQACASPWSATSSTVT